MSSLPGVPSTSAFIVAASTNLPELASEPLHTKNPRLSSATTAP
jgi:hypothetical protein